ATSPCAPASVMAKRVGPRAMDGTWPEQSPNAENLSRELDPGGALVAAGRVGLITHKDYEPASLVRSGSPQTARATSGACAVPTRWIVRHPARWSARPRCARS